METDDKLLKVVEGMIKYIPWLLTPVTEAK